jgi:hypothetical protein
MPDDLDDLLGNDSSDNSAPQGKGLRAQLEAVLAERNAMKEQLAQLQTENRARGVKDLAAKHSIPDLALDFFPKDADLTDESATAFVEKYGQLWGAQSATATTSPEQQAATAAAQQFASQANPAPAAPMTEEQYAAKLGEAKTKDELMRLIAELEQTAVVQVMGE